MSDKYNEFAGVCVLIGASICAFLCILLVLFIAGCSKGHADDTTGSSLADINLVYLAGGDASLAPACDFATFATHAAALGNHPEYVTALEASSGVLIRNPKTTCYPMDSAATISREGYIGWLHYIWSTKDAAALDRIKTYGDANSWIFGEGSPEMVDMTPLRPIIALMQSKMSLMAVGTVSDITEQLQGTLSGFRGHVLASYLWLWGRVAGQMGVAGRAAITQIYDSNKNDPIYAALYARWVGVDFDSAEALLKDTTHFPTDVAPITLSSFGWGSCPDFLTFLISYAIITGV